MASSSESADLRSVHCWKWQIGHCCLNDPKKQIIIHLTIFQSSNNNNNNYCPERSRHAQSTFISNNCCKAVSWFLAHGSHHQCEQEMALHSAQTLHVKKDWIYLLHSDFTLSETSEKQVFFKAVPISLMNLLPAGLLLSTEFLHVPVPSWTAGRPPLKSDCRAELAPIPPPLAQTTWNCSSPLSYDAQQDGRPWAK